MTFPLQHRLRTCCTNDLLHYSPSLFYSGASQPGSGAFNGASARREMRPNKVECWDISLHDTQRKLLHGCTLFGVKLDNARSCALRPPMVAYGPGKAGCRRRRRGTACILSAHVDRVRDEKSCTASVRLFQKATWLSCSLMRWWRRLLLKRVGRWRWKVRLRSWLNCSSQWSMRSLPLDRITLD